MEREGEKKSERNRRESRSERNKKCLRKSDMCDVEEERGVVYDVLFWKG